MLAIIGIGQITQKEYSSVIRNICGSFDSIASLYSRLCRESVFLYPVKNFSRFDVTSRMTCCAAALALFDAKIPYPLDGQEDIGILGTNMKGSIVSNISYYKDYIDTGRILARGNLFIYTLPSSPLAETAIHIGCRGPLIYMSFPQNQIRSLLDYAKKMILYREVSKMLTIRADEEQAICFLIAQKEGRARKKGVTFENAISIAKRVSLIRLDNEKYNCVRKQKHES